MLTSRARADGSRCPAAQAPVRDVVDLERYIDTRTHAGLCALHLAVLCRSHAAGERRRQRRGRAADEPGSPRFQACAVWFHKLSLACRCLAACCRSG